MASSPWLSLTYSGLVRYNLSESACVGARGTQVIEQDLETVAGEPKRAGKAVTDPRIAGAILNAISDETTRRILESTIPAGKAIEDIGSENGIPPSTVYRRVHELVAIGLLAVERIMFTHAGKRYLLYRSTVRGVRVEMKTGELKVQVTPNEDVADRFTRLWQSESCMARADSSRLDEEKPSSYV